MPTYEYLCQTCRHRFETWQKMADEPLTTCPECGGSIRRVLFPAGVVFKGQGFYVTDHNKSKTPANGSHENNGSNGSNGENGKSENGKSESSSTTTTESKAASSSSSESKPSSESKTTTTTTSSGTK